jgi:hypothetical protein
MYEIIVQADHNGHEIASIQFAMIEVPEGVKFERTASGVKRL